jgi:hypothetical protein
MADKIYLHSPLEDYYGSNLDALLKYAQFIRGFLNEISNIEKYNYNSLIYIVWKIKFRQNLFSSTCN